MKIKCIVKLPGRKAYSTCISNTLENFQQWVEGYIETVTLCDNLVIVCNEEGRINGLPYNCTICGCPFYGNLVIVGTDGEDFADVPMALKDARKLIPSLDDEGAR